MSETTEPGNGTNFSLPSGFIGPRCAVSVFLEGVECESIMDTGSQVTTISESFHKSHLSHLPIRPIHALLEIEGAGGQHVPYLGYIEVCVTFPQSITGQEEELVALALVVPECNFNNRVPLLIGTNVLFQLHDNLLNQNGSDFSQRLCPRDVMVVLQHIARTRESDKHTYSVRLHAKEPVTIPANQKCSVMADVRLRKNDQNKNFVLEPHEHHMLPVVLSNLSGHSVTLQPKSVVAQLCAALQITTPEPDKYVFHQKSDSENLKFNLDDSPIPEQWKERIITKLKSISEVFAVDDLSYGHTTAE